MDLHPAFLQLFVIAYCFICKAFWLAMKSTFIVIFLFDLYQIKYIQSSMSDYYGGMQTDRH